MKRLVFAAVFAFSLTALADAAALFTSKCKGCHGLDGRGKTKEGIKHKAPDMASAAWQDKHSDEQVREAIAEGSKENNKMKAYKDKLTADEIASLVQHIRTLREKAP